MPFPRPANHPSPISLETILRGHGPAHGLRTLPLAALRRQLSREYGAREVAPRAQLEDFRLSSRQFPEVYRQLGIDTRQLGCVMLALDPLDIVSHVPDGERDLYFSERDDFAYAAGAVGETTAHVTLLHGLLTPAVNYIPQIETVLGDWSPADVAVTEVGYFDCPNGEEPYYCIVAHLRPSFNLLEANARLRLLPHISTFPTYKAHITLAYIKNDPTVRDKWIHHLSAIYAGKQLPVEPGLLFY